MSKAPSGLVKRGNVWWISKFIGGKRIRASTGTGDLAEAELFLAHVTEEARRVVMYGDRPSWSFRAAPQNNG